MLQFEPHTISVKRRISSWMWSDFTEVITNRSCNIQPLSRDDILFDLNVKQYILFLETDDENYIQETDLVTDWKWKEYKVSNVDWFEWPIKNTMEVILIESKDD